MTTQNETKKNVSVVYDESVPYSVFEDETINENLKTESLDDIVEAALDSLYKKFLNDESLPDGVFATVYEGIRFDPDTAIGIPDPNEFTLVFSFNQDLQNGGGILE